MATIKEWLPDLLMISGAVAVSAGAWMIYPPAGYIVGGGLALLAGKLLAGS